MPDIAAAPETVSVLYRDEQVVAINKPAGLLVHRTNLDRHETRFAVQMVRDHLGQRVYPVHRLDKGTSGVLLFALDSGTAAVLQGAFAGGRIRKTYLAVVRGILPAEGVIDYPLSDQPEERWGEVPGAAVQEAVTGYRLLATAELPFAVGRYPTSRYSLTALAPVTGRRHQLRRHMKHLCHPIIGDTRYGEGRHNRFFRTELECHRMLLAAVELAFPHPVSGAEITVCAPVDDLYTGVIDRLMWRSSLPSRWLPASTAEPGSAETM